MTTGKDVSDMAASRSDVQADALHFVEQHRGEVVALTEALVAAPSPNLPGDETAPAEVVRAAADAVRAARAARPWHWSPTGPT